MKHKKKKKLGKKDYGNAHGDQKKRPKAIVRCDKAIAIYTSLVEEDGRDDMAANLAMCLSTRGDAFRERDRLGEAMADYDKAIDILARLFEREDDEDEEMAEKLAITLNHRCDTLKDLGKLPEALADYDRGIAIYTRLVEEYDRDDLVEELALSLNNYALTLAETGKHAEAIPHYDKVLELCTSLIGRKGEPIEDGHPFDKLALTLTNRGTARAELGKLSEALADYDRSVAIYSQLVELEGHEHLADAFASSLTNRGTVFGQQGKLRELLADYDKAISIIGHLVVVEGRKDLSSDFDLLLYHRRIKAFFMESQPDEAPSDSNKGGGLVLVQ